MLEQAVTRRSTWWDWASSLRDRKTRNIASDTHGLPAASSCLATMCNRLQAGWWDRATETSYPTSTPGT